MRACSAAVPRYPGEGYPQGLSDVWQPWKMEKLIFREGASAELPSAGFAPVACCFCSPPVLAV